MSKIQQTVTMDKTRKNTIRNTIYALLVAFTVVLSTTLRAINAGNTSSSNDKAVISVSTKPSTYLAPMENASLVKDFSNKELQYNDTLKQW